MSESDETLLGLFPLDLVLVPGEIVPLHIFEERYKRLIGERLDEGVFGIVLAEEDGVRECGTTARVVELVERLDDGRMNVLVRGERRFRIVELRVPDDSDDDYLRAEVQYFRDSEPQGSGRLREAVLEVFFRMLALLDVPQSEPEGDAPLSFRIAASVEFGAPIKQTLLESLSEEERLETLLTVLQTVVKRLEMGVERAAAIRGNGKGY